MVLHVTRECCRGVVSTVAHSALERLLIVVRLHVDLEVVAAIRVQNIDDVHTACGVVKGDDRSKRPQAESYRCMRWNLNKL